MKKLSHIQPIKKLAAYSGLASSFLAIANKSDAQIIYTDIPDAFIEIGDVFPLDIDGDSEIDFLFEAASISALEWSSAQVFGSLNTTSYSFGNPSNQVIGSMGFLRPYANALNAGFEVDAGAEFLSYDNNAFLASAFEGVPHGSFANVSDKYLGVKFLISGELHYGWIRLDCSTSPIQITLKDFAYEASPEAGIVTGDTSGELECFPPTVTSTFSIASGVKLFWSAVSDAIGYKVRYRQSGSTGSWSYKSTSNLTIRISGLTCDTEYEYQIKTLCSDGSETIQSLWSALSVVNIASCKLAAPEDEKDFTIYPNPVHSSLQLLVDEFSSKNITVEILNVMGEIILTSEMKTAHEMHLDVSALESGLYTLVLFDSYQRISSNFIKH